MNVRTRLAAGRCGRRWSATFLVCIGVVSAIHATRAESPPHADLIVVDAAVLTMDDAQPEAEALAVKGNLILAVGTSAEVRRLQGPSTMVIDGRGKTVVPGFNDAHIHPAPRFDEMSRLGRVPCDPSAVDSLDELVARLEAKANRTPPGEWVFGERYQDTKLGRHPTREVLDRASTQHPIYLTHSSGHVAAVNSRALELAGVKADTPDPSGGRFDRDRQGRPTGVLRETAKRVVLDAGPPIPEPTLDEWIDGIHRCFSEYLANGVTSVQHAGTSLDTVQKYALAQSRRRQVRIYAMLREPEIDALAEMADQRSRTDAWLKLGAVKHFHGNSLSGQTCW